MVLNAAGFLGCATGTAVRAAAQVGMSSRSGSSTYATSMRCLLVEPKPKPKYWLFSDGADAGRVRH
jgi:hypothetical protein